MKLTHLSLPTFTATAAWLRLHTQTDDPPAAGHSPATTNIGTRQYGSNLFLIGFLILFLELASIRWFAANVIFLQFFTNVVLLACFLGMSCGCMAARQQRNWLGHFPTLALGTVVAAIAVLRIYNSWAGLAIDVGHQVSPQEVFFGTEYRNPDVAQFTVPIDVIVAVFFILIALMFVGPGQVLGRAFAAFPNRVLGYTLNIGGSLAGIVVFSLISFLQLPPVIWFFVACAGIAYLLRQTGELTWQHVLALAALLAAVAVPTVDRAEEPQAKVFWSPYYQVTYNPKISTFPSTTLGTRKWCHSTAGSSLFADPSSSESHWRGAV